MRSEPARLGGISLRGCSYGAELARLAGLARLGEMIFIPRSYGIFHSVQSKNLLKRLFDQINSDVKPSCRINVLKAREHEYIFSKYS